SRPSYTRTRGAADCAEPLCQGLSNGAAPDGLVARRLPAAVEPAALEASLAAAAGAERQRAELRRRWRLRRGRAGVAGGRTARLLLERAAVTVDEASERAGVQLRWVGGAVCSHTLTRPVRRYDQHSGCPRPVERLRQLCDRRPTAAEIALRLTAEGFCPPKR